MREYGQTFRRHRILYSLIPLLAAVLAGIVVFSAPKKYDSSAGLWVDNGPAANSSLSSTSSSGDPSTFEQGILSELLATNSFDLAVGEGSALKGSVEGATKLTKENAIENAVATGTSSTTPGAQVLLLTYEGSSPQVARSTLGSLVTQLQKSTARYGQDYGKTATSYYQTQLTAAEKTRSAARVALSSYETAHHGSNSSNDATYAQLSSALATATSQVSTDSQALSEAQAESKLGVQGATVRVVDAPSLPTSPTKSKKKQLVLVVGAGLGGALLSLLLVVGLTKVDEDPSAVDVSTLSVPPIERRPRGLPVGTWVQRRALQTGSAHEEPRTTPKDEDSEASSDLGLATDAELTAIDEEHRDGKPSKLADRESTDIDAPRVRPRFGRSREDREPV